MISSGAGTSRRDWILGASAVLALPSLLARPGDAVSQTVANNWEAAVAKILRDTKPGTGKLALDVPELAENGNTVPFVVSVDSPMTEASYVRALHIISTGNPQPLISTYHLTPASGRATASGRLRLAGSQGLVTIAALSDGTFLMARREVKVTIGGCGG